MQTVANSGSKTSGGSNLDLFISLQQTSDGGFILSGDSASGISGSKTTTNYGNDDYWIVQLDANGNKLWEQDLGGSGSDNLNSFHTTSNGGFILGGNSASGISGSKTTTNYGIYDCWVVRLDANGNKLWERDFGGSGYDYLSSLQRTIDGGFILGGTSTSGISGSKTTTNYGISDYWVVRLDANGNKLWEQDWGGSSEDSLYSMQQTIEGGFILAGRSSSSVSGNKATTNYGGLDYWVVRLDASGDKLWEQNWGGDSSDDAPYSLQQTIEGGFILGGWSFSGVSGNKTTTNYGGWDYWIIKLGAPPTISVQRQTNGAVELTIVGTPSSHVALYSSTNLTSWALLTTLTNQTGTVPYTDPTAINFPVRFYKSLQMP